MMCEPQVFGLRAGLSLAKMPSDGRAGSPRLGLDTSLEINRPGFFSCIYTKYGKFLSISFEFFVKHKWRNWEECANEN